MTYFGLAAECQRVASVISPYALCIVLHAGERRQFVHFSVLYQLNYMPLRPLHVRNVINM
jgi:hypothetical protein